MDARLAPGQQYFLVHRIHSLLTHSNPVHFGCISKRVVAVECSFFKINNGSDSHIVVGIPRKFV